MSRLLIFAATILFSLELATGQGQEVDVPGSPGWSDCVVGDAGCGDVVQSGICCRPGIFGYAEWLNWEADRRGLDFASFVNPVWLTPVNEESLDYDRNSGLRVGFGYRFASCWDVSWNYTYFETDAQGHANTADHPNLELIATRSQFDAVVDHVAAASELDYHVHDIEAGRWVAWNPSLSTRFFGGFRWAMIDQHMEQEYRYRDLLDNAVTSQIYEAIELDAYGIRLGMEANWHMAWGLRLFGRAAGSVLAGDFEIHAAEVDGVDGTILDGSDDYTQAVPVLESALGIGWSYDAFEVSGGYELNTWFNMAEVDRSSYDLLFHGFFVRASLSR